MARRKTYQKPEPKVENGQWKIRYWAPQEQLDGSIRREQRTKCLGSTAEMNITMARKERDRFLHRSTTLLQGSSTRPRMILTDAQRSPAARRWATVAGPSFG